MEQERMANAQLLMYGSKHLEQNFFFFCFSKEVWVPHGTQWFRNPARSKDTVPMTGKLLLPMHNSMCFPKMCTVQYTGQSRNVFTHTDHDSKNGGKKIGFLPFNYFSIVKCGWNMPRHLQLRFPKKIVHKNRPARLYPIDKCEYPMVLFFLFF